MSNRRVVTWTFILLVALGPMLQPTLAHGGQADGHHDDLVEDNGVVVGPQAQRLTPETRYAEQLNPHAAGPMVVWQEREVGRDWDIMAFNLSTGGPAFPVTLEAVDQTNPVVRGEWIAWEEHHAGSTVDIAVLNLRTGEQFQIPDTGLDDVGPTLASGKVYWQAIESKNAGVIRGYDLVERKPIYPLANTTVVTPPSAHGPYLAWAEGSNVEAKVRVRNTWTGEDWSMPSLWSVREGPELSRWGVSVIVQANGPQRGTYAMLYNWTNDRMEPFRTGKYPHQNLGACDTGVVWDQFATNSEMPTVAIWDGYTEKVGEFASRNHDATCSGDAFIYEKVVPAEDEDLGDTRYLYILDLARTRAPAKSEVLIDPGLERGIYEGATLFTGRIVIGDPREPLEGLWARVDGGELQPVQAQRTGPESYRWRFHLNAKNYFNGQHTLNIIAVDAKGTQSERGFIFFTSGVYQTDPSIFDQPLVVPVERPAPFPLNIAEHYQDYRQFYNTILLGGAVLAVIGYLVYRYLARKPEARPEYVRPDGEEEAPPPEPGGPSGPQRSVTFQQP